MVGAYICVSSVPDELYLSYQSLLGRCGLRDEGDCEFTVLYRGDDGAVYACGSRRGNVLKQIAVAPELEAHGFCASIVTELVADAVAHGEVHLFLYTSPEHIGIFSDLGFFPVVRTGQILMMENHRNGLESFIAALPKYHGRVGAVVCNCDPFTLGHRYLIEQAISRCDELMVFVLSENSAMFSPQERFILVREGTADLKNVHVFQSREYLISRATFPTYFIKDKVNCSEAACDLDIAIFTQCLAPKLNISVRFVGSEPTDQVTAEYNRRLHAELPKHGIILTEFARYKNISASTVRKLITEGRIGEAINMLPQTTYEYCQSKFGAGS